jgi:glycosyltransferase involved in cell wall biosynthesis
MRVLYANHTGIVSGAEHSLVDLLRGLPPGVDSAVACPAGPLADVIRSLGKPVAMLPEMEGSFRMHPVHTARGIATIIRGGIGLRRLTRRLSIHLLHANSTRAGLMGAVAARLGGPPLIVSVRDCLPASPAGNAVRRVISRSARVVIANSQYTATGFCRGRPGEAVTSIHNPVDVTRFNPSRWSRDAARALLGLGRSTPVLGVVAQLAAWKGQDDGIRCAALLRRDWPDVRLLLVGDVKFRSAATRHDNQAYARSLRRLADELALDGRVRFLGERDDIPLVLRALDVLLVPSWEEPFGRTVIEAMAMETPVVATNRGGPTEIIDDGIDGVLLPPRQPELWAEAIGRLLGDRDRMAALSQGGRRKVCQSFALETHVSRVLEVYDRALGTPRK